MNISKRVAMAAGGALLAAGASLFAIGQTVNPLNSGLNVGSANVCPSGQTTPAPCSKTATVTFKFTSGGSIGKPSVLMLGAPNLDFRDAKTGTCTTNGTGHTYSANDTCTVDVKFAPMHPGPRRGAVVLYDTASPANSLATAYVYGMGIGPQITFSSKIAPKALARYDFGDFRNPAVDGNGNIFVANYTFSEVKEFVAAGGYTTVNTFSDFLPSAVAVDGSGNLFVGFGNGGNVTERLAASGFTTEKTVYCCLPGGSAGIALDGVGNIFVAGTDGDQVDEILAASGYTTVKKLGSGFHWPEGIAVDGSGNVFTAEIQNHSVKEILAAGGYTTVKELGGGFSFKWPDGVAVDASGNVFVTTWDGLMEIPAAGGYSTVITLDSGTRASGLAVDGKGNLFLAGLTEIEFSKPPSLNFALTAMGSTNEDSPQSVTIANDGNAQLTFSLPTAGDNPSLAENFLWDANSTCEQNDTSSLTAFTLAPGASCTMTLDFAPTTMGRISGNAVLTDNNLNTSAATQSIALKGYGMPPSTPFLTSPVPGSTLSGSIATFAWTPGTDTPFRFRLGTTLGGNDLYDSGSISQTSATATHLPTGGQTVYASLSFKWDQEWHATTYTFLEASLTHPTLLTPTPGSTLSGSNVAFIWDPLTETTFRFRLGTVPRGNDVYDTGRTNQTSASVNNLPTNGSKIYATLSYQVNGVWHATGYIYTAQ